MRRTLKDLALALVNATLLLAALCLALGLTLANRVDGLVETFSRNLISVEPLREDIQGATAELAALRADMVALGQQTGEINSATLQRLGDRIDGIENRMEDARARVQALTEAPAQLMDHAIETAADQFAQSVNEIRGCKPPSPPET